jgi:hypothetical protein
MLYSIPRIPNGYLVILERELEQKKREMNHLVLRFSMYNEKKNPQFLVIQMDRNGQYSETIKVR